MKVLLVNTEFYRGGAAQIARTLYQSLNEDNKIKCNFAYGRGKRVGDQKVFKFAFLPEIYFHALLTRLTGIQGYCSWFSTKKLEKYITKEKFDLIHLHNLHGYYLNIDFIKFLGKLNIPVVWALHDGWPMTGRCAYLFECDQWKTGCGRCPDLKRYPKTYLDSSNFMWKKKKEYFNSNWCPIIVCPSKWLADMVKKSYLDKYQIAVIPNAIDTEVFKPKNKDIIRKKLRISSKKKVILFVAADLKDEIKGTKYFFEALQYVEVENYMVITVGKKVNFGEYTENKFEVKQLGYISDKRFIANIYNAADIFCITSIDEVFGLTVTEAMACGVPVVGFKVGGIPEQATKDCGIMVEAKDTKALGKAMGKLLNDEEMRRNFSLNCRERVLQNYTIEKFRDRYIKVYNDALRRANQ